MESQRAILLGPASAKQFDKTLAPLGAGCLPRAAPATMRGGLRRRGMGFAAQLMREQALQATAA